MSANSFACSTHPGWKLSRDCIQDAYIAKRTGVFDEGGLASKLCSLILHQLRETQLAPHQEEKMVVGRYLKKQQEKWHAPDVVVVLRGGLIQSVYSSNPFTQVFVADYDLHDPDDDEYEARKSAEDRVAKGDMHEVY